MTKTSLLALSLASFLSLAGQAAQIEDPLPRRNHPLAYQRNDVGTLILEFYLTSPDIQAEINNLQSDLTWAVAEIRSKSTVSTRSLGKREEETTFLDQFATQLREDRDQGKLPSVNSPFYKLYINEILVKLIHDFDAP